MATTKNVTKAQALKRVTTLSAKAREAAQRHDQAQADRDKAILGARTVSEPATYQEIAQAAAVTKDRVSQIIQAQRKQA